MVRENFIQPNLESWIDVMSGWSMCDCDHGCRDSLADQSHKAILIIKALMEGKPKEEIDKICQMAIEESGKIFYETQIKKVKAGAK